jgi:hypothetical protein
MVATLNATQYRVHDIRAFVRNTDSLLVTPQAYESNAEDDYCGCEADR